MLKNIYIYTHIYAYICTDTHSSSCTQISSDCYLLFLKGHPSQNSIDSLLLNFCDLMGIGDRK